MPRTCIICGGPTGSREHIFPAALGGRRTNKGIYCGDHNNAYSDLAGIISEQLAIFNAQLGVVGDHADAPTSVTMTDVASGREVQITNAQVQFKGPQTLSERTVDGKTVVEMSFTSRKEADEWVRAQKAQGNDIELVGQGQKQRYHVGTAHKQIKLGGDQEGLRAIGYIAQTFLAHSFPDIARLPELQGIKDYTLKKQGSGFVWWEFDTPGDLPANRFPFGHRIIVGVNAADGTAYARISFFSALHFAILLGALPIAASRAIITDIDPLAKAPPQDIHSWGEDVAIGAVSRPTVPTASLAEAISSGKAEAQLHGLMRRIEDHERGVAAAKILRAISTAATLSASDRKTLFAGIVDGEAQRVLRLVRAVAKDCNGRATNNIERMIAAFLVKASELDPAKANGLTAEATRALTIACNALAQTMQEDFEAGRLDKDRMEMLIGGGAGMHVVGTAVLQKFIE